jgi:hypothetical protein
MLQREALDRIAALLAHHSARGVVLKGNGLALRPPSDGGSAIPRGSADLDIYLAPGLADRVRQDLLVAGFTGDPGAAPTAVNHLAPVFYRGEPVEIHTRLVPSFWGLPEREILTRAWPVDPSGPLDTLDPAGQILHAVIHTAQDSFSHGLKTAWDLLWIIRGASTIDWGRLARWVHASRLTRGFWAPLSVLSEGLRLPIPSTFLAAAPTDARQRRLDGMARERLFCVAESPDEVDPLGRQRLRWLMHDSRWGFLRYLASQAADRARNPGIGWGTLRRVFKAWKPPGPGSW